MLEAGVDDLVKILREYLIQKHGMLFADNCGSRHFHNQFVSMMNRVLPDVRPVPIPLDDVIQKALAKDRADRFQSADEMHRALLEVLQSHRHPVAIVTKSALVERDLARHPHESRYLKLDCSKARALLGWAPKLPLLTALEWTVEWYRAFKNNKDMRVFTEKQIERFAEIAAT